MEKVVAGLIDFFVGFMLQISGPEASMLMIDVNSSNVGEVVKVIWNLLAPFAMSLTVAYFAIDLNKKMVFEGTDVNIKTFGFPFIKLMAATVVIHHGLDIFDALVSLNNSLITAAGEGAKGTAFDNSIGDDMAKALGFWGLIIIVLPLLIALIVGLICKLVWVYKGFTFKVEFIARYMFAPIALADIYSGANAAAIRYIKGTIAFALYGVSLIVLPKLVNVIAFDQISSTINTLLDNGVDGIGGVLHVVSDMLIVCVAPIAGIGIVGAAKSITREALGA